MDTTERMMIMGMCLQGLLANPNHSAQVALADGLVRVCTAEEVGDQITRNVKLAHRYADALDPPPEVTDAQVIAALTRTAYGVIVAADTDGSGKWASFDDARNSLSHTDMDRVDGVFERVSRWYHDPTGYPETLQDRIIAAVVAAYRGGLPDDRQRPLFESDAKGG